MPENEEIRQTEEQAAAAEMSQALRDAEPDTSLFGNDGPVAKHTEWGSPWKDRNEFKQAYFARRNEPGYERHEEAVAEMQRIHMLQSKRDEAQEAENEGLEPDPAVKLPTLPAGKSWDVGLAAEVLNCAAVEGIPETDLKDGLKYFAEHGSGEIPAAEVAEQTLREIWKGEYDVKIAAARDAIRPYPQLAAILERTGLGNSPPLLQWLAERGASRAGIQAEIDRLSATPEYRTNGPKHDEVVEQVRLLYRKLYAGH